MGNIAFMKELQKKTPFNMSIDPTIFSMNLHEMQKLNELAQRLDMPITFQIAAVANDYYHNGDMDVLKIDKRGRLRLIEFLKRRIEESSLLDALAYYYAEVVENMEGASARGLPCPFADQGLLLNPDGSLQYCHNSRPIGNVLETSSSQLYNAPENIAYRDKVRNESCPSCRMSCLFFVSLRKEVLPFLSFVIKRMFGIHRLSWRKPKLSKPSAAQA
jgi:hypothetical protein